METKTQTIDALRQAAAEALSSGQAAVVIGYGHSDGAGFAVPVFARTAEQAEGLVFDGNCYANLAVYLSRPEVRRLIIGSSIAREA